MTSQVKVNDSRFYTGVDNLQGFNTVMSLCQDYIREYGKLKMLKKEIKKEILCVCHNVFDLL